MPQPSVLEALRRSARALGRCLWLAPVGMALGWLARAATGPAPFFMAAIAGAGAADDAGLEGGLAALLSPRALATAAGLWLAGLLLRWLLRLVWIAGALPTLGEALSGREAPAFAAGVAWRLPRLLPTAALGFLLEGAALGTAVGVAAAAAALSGVLDGGGHPGAALLVALGLTAGLAAPLLAGLLSDAALCRAALRGEGPGRAFAAGALRLGKRPSAFAAVGLAAGGAAVLLVGSLDAASGSALQLLATRVPPELLAVPELGAVALATLLAALLEVWRLGAVAVLACCAAPGD